MNDKVKKTKLPWAAAGEFIKDHGIAIFLVVFFVVIIYPEQANERKDWITQITKLQDSLDPSKRPISKDQAEIVLELVTDAFIQSIESSMQTELILHERQFYSGAFSSSWGDDEVTTVIFGEEFSISKNGDIDAQSKVALEKYNRLIKKRELSLRQNALLALEKSTRSARHTTGGLRSFVYSDGTLSDIWESAFTSTYSDFSKNLIEAYANSARSEFTRDQFVDFLEDADANVPTELLQLDDIKSPSLVIFDFRKKIRTNWKTQISGGNSPSIVERVTERL